MKQAKKILTIVSVVTMICAVGIIIAQIFGANVFSLGSALLKILLSFATISVASIFSVSALGFINKNKIMGIVSLTLIAIATVLGLIEYWSGFTNDFLWRITVVLAVLAILFNIIVSLVIKHGKNHFKLQIVLYALIVVLDIIITLATFGVGIFAVQGVWQIFAVICLVVFGLFCAIAILGKKEASDQIKPDIKEEDKVVLSKEEYNSLLEQIENLKVEIKLLRTNSKK